MHKYNTNQNADLHNGLRKNIIKSKLQQYNISWSFCY